MLWHPSEFDPRVKPERGTYELDPEHPLARGLRFAFTFDEHAGRVVFAGGSGKPVPYVLGDNLSWSARLNGLQGNNDVAAFVRVLDGMHPTQYTVACRAIVRNFSRKMWVRTDSGEGGSFSHILGIDASGHPYASVFDGATKTTTGTTAIATGLEQWSYASTAANGGSLRVFCNGREEGTAASVSTLWTGGDRYKIGAGGSNAGGGLDGDIEYLYFYLYAHPPDNIRWMQVEPYAMFRPVVRRAYSAPAGGSPYTLTAAAGSFALAGQAATLRAARTITAAAGAYTTTGQAATLKAARVLPAAVGTFAATGQAAGLRVGRVLSAAAGSFAVAGQAASLRVGRVLTAAAGTFSLVGKAAALTYSGAATTSAWLYRYTQLWLRRR